MRTYSRSEWIAAAEAWLAVRLGPRWEPFRRQAAERGILWPPSGSRWDAYDDPRPSQVAVIGQAIDDTPDLLRAAIASSRSWSQVVGVIIRERAAYRERAALAERDDTWDRQDEPTPREATVALKHIIDRIRDS